LKFDHRRLAVSLRVSAHQLREKEFDTITRTIRYEHDPVAVTNFTANRRDADGNLRTALDPAAIIDVHSDLKEPQTDVDRGQDAKHQESKKENFEIENRRFSGAQRLQRNKAHPLQRRQRIIEVIILFLLTGCSQRNKCQPLYLSVGRLVPKYYSSSLRRLMAS